MALVTCVFRREGVFYFRTRVPARLRGALGRREVWRSLRTHDPRTARRRAGLLQSSIDALWTAIRPSMTRDEASALIDAWLIEGLQEDLRIRNLPRSDAGGYAVMRTTADWLPDELVRWVDAAEIAALAASGSDLAELTGPGEFLTRITSAHGLATEGFRKPLQHATTWLDVSDRSIASKTVEAHWAKLGLTVDPADEGFEAAVDLMMQAQADLQRAIARRDDAGWFWRPSAPQPDPAHDIIVRLTPAASRVATTAPLAPITSGPSSATSHEPLSRTGEEFLDAEKTAGQSSNRTAEKRAAIELFRRWLGDDPGFSTITARQAGDYLVDLTNTPTNASKYAHYKHLDPRSRAAEARRRGETKLLTPTTINSNYIDPLRDCFEWGIRTGKVSINPFAKVRAVERGRAAAARERKGFASEQLVNLFSHPVFIGAAGTSGKPLYRHGPVTIDDWRFWLPVMSLFSGARLNELCGLNVTDFDVESGVSFFHIRSDTELKSVKTEAGIRRVPVHSELERIGLLSRVTSLRSSGESRLFPTLKPNSKGYLSGEPTKFFGRLIDQAVSTDPAIVFHSLRHTFITALRGARVPKDVRMALVGHEDGDTHDDYGEQPMEVMNEHLQSVAFRGLDLSGLRR